MPELPEVETIANQLHQVLPGKTIASIQILRDKSAQTNLDPLINRSISEVRRIGKMVVISTKKVGSTSTESSRLAMSQAQDDKLILLVHLKMTGQLIYQKSVVSSQYSGERVVGGHPSQDWVEDLPSKHTRIVIEFEDGSTLYFNDMRVFGWMKVVTSDKLQELSDKMPPDVVDREFTSEYLASQLKRSGRAIKLVILDQQMMGGMGNIYANDALWWARVDPKKPAKELTEDEAERLHGALVKVLRRGIELGGATISDYKQTDGMGGNYQDETPTYFRDGKECLRSNCKETISKVKLGGRGTYFCIRCQASE